MSTQGETGAQPGLSDETILLLNRAMLVLHCVGPSAHELNNVFQMISGSAELLQANPLLVPELKPRLDVLRRQSSRGEGIVRELASLARGDASAPQPVDLVKAVDRALDLRRFEHRRRGIAVSLNERSLGPFRVRANPESLQQLLLSLLLNAEQALDGSTGGGIGIEISGTTAGVDLFVTDNGNGALIADAFMPFVTSRPPHLCAGLGLTAARTLAIRLGGEIELSHSDTGTTARVSFPAATG